MRKKNKKGLFSMKTIDHHLIGLEIEEDMLGHMSLLQRKMFLLGCIEPDANPFTYLKGSMHFQKLHGHNYENSCRIIKKYLQVLTNTQKWSIFSYYKMGKLIHYAADAFTFPHNSEFKKSLRAHIEYEEKLHQQFMQDRKWEKLRLRQPYENTLDLFEQFKAFHQVYIRECKNQKDDIRCIYQICGILCNQILPGMQTIYVDIPISVVS